jgi:hypothetical protein
MRQNAELNVGGLVATQTYVRQNQPTSRTGNVVHHQAALRMILPREQIGTQFWPAPATSEIMASTGQWESVCLIEIY